MTATEIPLETMPLSERLALLSRIWDTLPPFSPEVESREIEMPEWHADVLHERLREVEEGRAKWYTIDEIEERRVRRKP